MASINFNDDSGIKRNISGELLPECYHYNISFRFHAIMGLERVAYLEYKKKRLGQKHER